MTFLKSVYPPPTCKSVTNVTFSSSTIKYMENDNNLTVIYILVKNELTAVRAESSFRRNFNVYKQSQVELGREKKKQRRRISWEGKPENFKMGIRILEMLAATKMKMSGSAKKKKKKEANRQTYDNRELKLHMYGKRQIQVRQIQVSVCPIVQGL